MFRNQGVEEDVQTAKQAIISFNNEIEKLVKVRQNEFLMLVRNKGTQMRFIESILGVSLTIAPSSYNEASHHDTAATLIIRGAPESVENAAAAVTELASFVIEIPFQKNSNTVRVLLSNGGEKVKQCEDEFSVAIDVKRSDTEENVIKIIGTKAQVMNAETKIRAMFEENEHETMKLEVEDRDAVSYIIGKGGETVKKIQSETKSHISVEFDDILEKHIVHIRAPKRYVEDAANAVNSRIEQHAKENISLKYPFLDLQALQQKKKDIEEANPGCKIGIQRNPIGSEEEDIFTVFIRGDETAVANAKKSIANLMSSQTENVINVPSVVVPSLIGSKGSTISKLQQETGASVSIQHDEKDGLRSSRASIRGTPEQVEQASERIQEIIVAYKKENLELYMDPSALGTLIGKGGSTLNQIREETSTNIDIHGGSRNKPIPDSNKHSDRFGTKVDVS